MLLVASAVQNKSLCGLSGCFLGTSRVLLDIIALICPLLSLSLAFDDKESPNSAFGPYTYREHQNYGRVIELT